ncbi:hypothetical protein RB597_008023 [Gaeumannomyces tritici]
MNLDMATSQALAASPSASNPNATANAASQPWPAATPAGASSSSSSSCSSSAPPSTSDPAAASDKPPAEPATTKTLPTRTRDSLNVLLLDQYTARDSLHQAALVRQRETAKGAYERAQDRLLDFHDVRKQYNTFPARLYGEGYNGFGNGYTHTGNAGPRIVYPQDKPRPGKRQTPGFKCSRKDMRQQAEQHEELVPVRIDVEYDRVKLRDTFTWNLHDRLVNVDHFSRMLLEDLGLKDPALYAPVLDQVIAQVNEQLQDFYPTVFSEEDALDPELPYSAYKNDEMRILIKLNITIGQVTLVDQFEWEINNPLNSPEDFANSMVRDLALSGEFATAIAHCIREQSQLFTKSLYSIGHPFDGRPVEDPDLVMAFLPSPIPSVFRPQQQAKEYAPYLYELTDADLERNEVTLSREQRRQKRSVNRRGGPTLPDLKERQRTIRTLVVSSVLPGAALSVDDSRLYKKTITAGPGGARKRGVRDGDLSESDESDDSAPDSPAMGALTGTARTRGLRGAAATAQQRMANIGRSETPEASGTIYHHHETRTSRRFVPRDARDSTEDPNSLVVKLHIPSHRLRRILQGERIRLSTPAGSQTPSQTPAMPPARAPSVSNVPGSMGPPPTTPSAAAQSLPSGSPTATTLPQAQLGRVRAPLPPSATGEPLPQAPAVPDWLTEAIRGLEETYPDDYFEGTMRYCAVDRESNRVVSMPTTDQIPPNIVFYFIPRIKCLDCPGKLYTPGPGTTAENFEVHLKNRAHREKVNQRTGNRTLEQRPKAPSEASSITAAGTPASASLPVPAAPSQSQA